MSTDDGQNKVHTVSVAKDVAEADPVELGTTATTRTMFKPSIVGKGVRGWIVRQKRGKNGRWVEQNEIDFRKTDPGFGVSIEIGSDGTRRLFETLEQLYEIQGEGVPRGDRTFEVIPTEEAVRVTDHQAAGLIRKMVEQGHSAEMWRELAAADPHLADRLAAGQLLESRRATIAQFGQGLTERPADESFWQDLFERHPWMLQCASGATVYVLEGGETYIGGKLPYGRQGVGGMATDFVTSDASTKSFGVVEIKTPSADLTGGVYRGKRNTDLDVVNRVHVIHADLGGAVVQTRTQISVAVENFSNTLSQHPQGGDLNTLHPKGILIIGMLEGMDEHEQRSFNQFRHGLHSLTVLTFDELYRRLAITYDVEVQEPRRDAIAVGPEREYTEPLGQPVAPPASERSADDFRPY